MPRFIEVALPVRLYRPLTYAIEGPWADDVRLGARVVVPLRKGRAVGVVTALDVEGNGRHTIRRVLDLPNEPAALPEGLLKTCRWMAQYYAAPLGLVLRTALPTLLSSAQTSAPQPRGIRVVSIARELPSLAERDVLFVRAPKQRALYEQLESLGGSAPVSLLRERGPFSASALTALAARGFVSVAVQEAADPFARISVPWPAFEPTSAQREAIGHITSAAAGSVTLLHGVTGSGKTLVYLEALKQVLQRGRSAIVLVPEIALTPQTVGRFRAVFGDQVAVVHSALGDRERMVAWRALRAGTKRIAVGARSAIFAPLENVGAIVVDEEHEATYKQEETPRYHARDVAIVRARMEGAVVVLGSATPSLESWANAQGGRYKLLRLPERVGGAALPRVRVVDLRRDPAHVQRETPRDPFRFVISEQLETALRDRLTRSEQSLLLLNRRGYSAFVQCNTCGDVVTCPRCSIALTYHRAPETLVCHYCAYRTPRRDRCERCGSPTLRRRGLGTQQLEELIGDRFPAARIARMDVDTTGGRFAHATILDRVGRGDADILLGTQMIAKGLDFPNVTLVGVVDADVGINLPDFRASERTFQLLSQVAGRAGRGPKGGEVIIQTRNPTHHAVRCAVAHDFEAFVREELPGRESPVYPPMVRLTRIVLSAIEEVTAADLAIAAVDWLRRVMQSKHLSGISFVGPAPCPIEKIKLRWRWHVVIKADDAGQLTRLLTYFSQRFPVPSKAEARASIDRDPVTML
ncbi:MAG TPA: primosomal protein N' [Gemmatimonadaceae bacterium]|nr:primosomal protein N' [Gemmatimonadaceae bacterium]